METLNHAPIPDGEIVTLLKKAQTALEGPDDRGKWMTLEQVIRSLVSRNLYENLPITSWAYDPELGKIEPQFHQLKDLNARENHDRP